MARKEILVVTCDKCGFEEADTSKFLHVTVSEVTLDQKKSNKGKILSSRDLCIESCVGLPAVNRDK